MEVEVLEHICLKFYNSFLGPSECSRNVAVYWELGTLPLSYDAKVAAIEYHVKYLLYPISPLHAL
jgi:hypothetical protein